MTTPRLVTRQKLDTWCENLTSSVGAVQEHELILLLKRTIDFAAEHTAIERKNAAVTDSLIVFAIGIGDLVEFVNSHICLADETAWVVYVDERISVCV